MVGGQPVTRGGYPRSSSEHVAARNRTFAHSYPFCAQIHMKFGPSSPRGSRKKSAAIRTLCDRHHSGRVARAASLAIDRNWEDPATPEPAMIRKTILAMIAFAPIAGALTSTA